LTYETNDNSQITSLITSLLSAFQKWYANLLLPFALQPTVGFGLSNNNSICPYLSPTLSIFSLPALEDLFLLLLFILSWFFLFVSSLPVVRQPPVEKHCLNP
jgi:hypothetical protein